MKMYKIVEAKGSWTTNRAIKTVFCFVLGFGIGFFVSWIGVVFFSSVPHVTYSAHRNIIFADSLDRNDVVKIDDFGFYPKILCYFLVDPPTHKGAIHVKNTWGQRCDKTIFFSTKNDTILETVALNVTSGYEYLWEKSISALDYLYSHYSDDYDWFLKADDDTYIIVENLRYFLLGQNYLDPIYFGVKFKQHVQQGYMSGGGGYVFSKEALYRVVNNAFKLENTTLCPYDQKTGAEDLNIGKCFEAVGVTAGDSLDNYGKPRFFSHSPSALLYKVPIINRLHWYWKYIWHKHSIGPECCSPHLISFHQIDPRTMWTLEFLLYRMYIHRDLQPSERNYSTSTLSPSEITTIDPIKLKTQQIQTSKSATLPRTKFSRNVD